LRSEIYGSQKKFAPENKKIVFDFAVSKSFFRTTKTFDALVPEGSPDFLR